jgi:hypothetical protein
MAADLSTFRFVIPLPGGRHLLIEGDFPVSEAQWDQFIAVLDAMKPGLVSIAEAMQLKRDLAAAPADPSARSES